MTLDRAVTQPRILLDNITKRFGARLALQNISLSLGAGRSLALIGPTMAGKTTLLKIIIGLFSADGGRVLIDGEALSPEVRRARIGMLFQHNALFDSLSVWENVAFRLLAEKNMSRGKARDAAHEILSRVGLPPEVADLFPADLSGGMQKRVGFARAIISKPDILLLDNPTAGLDPILAARINAMISSLARERGASVIAITDASEKLIAAYDEIAVLVDSMLYWHDTSAAAQSASEPHLRQLLSGARDGPIKAAI